MSINTTNIIAALNNRETSDTDLHNGFVEMLESAKTLDKKSIIDSAEIAKVFRHPVMERGYMKQAISWIQANTPIRIKFKDNGHFDKIGFAKKPEWHLDTLRSTSWFDYEKAKTTKAPKANIERGLQALAREVARAAFESGNPLMSLDSARNRVQHELAQLVADEIKTERFAEWSTQREQDLIIERRNEPKVSEAAQSLADKVAAA